MAKGSARWSIEEDRDIAPSKDTLPSRWRPK